ncbi:MAG: hypothetical protein AB7H97_08835 [Pseudobdellovibrionaceae bacterium]
MNEVQPATANAGEEVVRAVGELSATVKDAAKAAAETGADHEEVKGWLTTIIKTVLAAFKP